MNSIVGLIFNGSHDTIHGSRLKKSAFTAESKKKEKKAETRFVPRRGRKMRKPNIALVFRTPNIKNITV